MFFDELPWSDFGVFHLFYLLFFLIKKFFIKAIWWSYYFIVEIFLLMLLFFNIEKVVFWQSNLIGKSLNLFSPVIFVEIYLWNYLYRFLQVLIYGLNNIFFIGPREKLYQILLTNNPYRLIDKFQNKILDVVKFSDVLNTGY